MGNGNDILNELKEIAPALSKVEKKPLQEVPVNYFASFPAAMMKKVREQELAEVAPTLARQEKINTLDVPAGYFKEFSGTMLKKVSVQQKTKSGVVPKWQESLNNALDGIATIIFKPKYAFAFAGTISVIVIAIMMLTKVEQCTDLECKMASLSDSEINTYLNNNSDVYSDEIFESSVDESTTANDVYKEALKDLSDEELSNAILD